MLDVNMSETVRILVVGRILARQDKILSLITPCSAPDDAIQVELVPCLAAIDSYEAENENGSSSLVRYLTSFVCSDGNAMTKFFDDEELRQSLQLVLMVGYEWIQSDEKLIETYFKTNDITIRVHCVQPNDGIATLQEEMDLLKGLSEAEKAHHFQEKTLGPPKMAEFIRSSLENIRIEQITKHEQVHTKATDVDGELPNVESHEELDDDSRRTLPVLDPEDHNYACRMCRTLLFGQAQLAPSHAQSQHSFKRGKNAKEQSCQSLFCSEDVLDWLAEDLQDPEGKLSCPNCSYKVGHWKWSGAQCSCGTWVTPAIQIPSSKVDVVLPASTQAKLQTITNPAFPQ